MNPEHRISIISNIRQVIKEEGRRRGEKAEKKKRKKDGERERGRGREIDR